MPELNQDFVDMLAALLEEGAEFLVVGAYAMAVHGVSRATGDIDLWVRPTKENALLVWRALARFGAPVEAMDVRPEDFERPGNVYQIGVPPRRIDLLTSISGVQFPEAWEGRVLETVRDLDVPFLSRALLLKNKTTTGRTKDLADVELLKSP